jgi:hypothetical protein
MSPLKLQTFAKWKLQCVICQQNKCNSIVVICLWSSCTITVILYMSRDMWQRRGMQLPVMMACCSWFISPWPAKPFSFATVCSLHILERQQRKVCFSFSLPFITAAPATRPSFLTGLESIWLVRVTGSFEDRVNQTVFSRFLSSGIFKAL